MSRILWQEENWLINDGTITRDDRWMMGGTVTVNGNPASRRVAVFNRNTLQLVGVTRSLVDGTWRLNGMNEYPERSLFAVAFDDEQQKYNAEIADFLTQVAPEQAPTNTGD